MAERRHRWVLAGGIGAIITGIPLLAAYGLGALFIVAGIATLWITGGGKRWDSLTGGQRAAAFPGVALGVVVMVVILAGMVVLGIAAGEAVNHW